MRKRVTAASVAFRRPAGPSTPSMDVPTQKASALNASSNPLPPAGHQFARRAGCSHRHRQAALQSRPAFGRQQQPAGAVPRHAPDSDAVGRSVAQPRVEAGHAEATCPPVLATYSPRPRLCDSDSCRSVPSQRSRTLRRPRPTPARSPAIHARSRRPGAARTPDTRRGRRGSPCSGHGWSGRPAPERRSCKAAGRDPAPVEHAERIPLDPHRVSVDRDSPKTQSRCAGSGAARPESRG